MNGPPFPTASVCGLTPEMIHRYSRHLLLPSFGVDGQLNLSKASILVVGAGGLGSPIAMYLAACGVGCLGIVDGDNVELNNLHRQIIHTEAYVGEPKVKSAAATCHAINSTVRVVEHREALLASNALDIMSQYDVIVDATDNLPSRYMISDCCVVLNKPLVSGAALGLEGQLTVYHYNGGPCYRCLFPTPPPATACQRCSDSGVLGVVPGIIGCLQALEAIKVASSIGKPLSGRMLLFDALSGHIRIVKLRGRSLNCDVCGENSMFTRETFQSFDYENFTQSPFFPRITEYKKRVDSSEPHILVDVRPAHHFQITALTNSISIPLSSLKENFAVIDSAMDEIKQGTGLDASIYVICRRGNDSQRAAKLLHENGFSIAKDIIGGLESWAQEIDHSFPMY
ncbi:unnamed protein product [Spirodela intermedia]|uniref:Adenylyltransferase and sulfurtransferase MOCS3 n=1 Tax=Spirodela intermedia TaxID=51605 RepID=A0A7I8IUT7_SPIIN|nr:unnamed protein product [Spirodela intermedia]CAA6661392.1 unnamed protein product [Spirodela intermedia]